MRTATALLLALLLLALPACQMNERMSGTAFGATGGAILGGLIGQSVTGALVGGVAGGVVGYLVGDYLADQRERCSPCAQPAMPNPCDPCAPGAYYAPTSYTEAYAAPRVGAVRTVDRSREASDEAVAQGKRAATLPQATQAYERATRIDPSNPEAWNALGLARNATGDGDGARAAFRQALQVDPNHWAARQNLIWAGGTVR